MGIFDIWRPDPEKGKEKPKAAAAPFALPHGEAPKHFLPGPAAEPQKPAPKTVKEVFAIFAPTEEKKKAEAEKPKAKSLMDALIPEEERGGIYHGRDVFRHGPEAQESAYHAPPAPTRKVYGWTFPAPEEFADRLPSMFNLELLWDDVQSQRRLPWFEREARTAFQTGNPPALSLVPVAPANDPEVLGYAFGVPRHVMDAYLQDVSPAQEVAAVNAFWDEILWPLFGMITPAFELVKPEDLPGWFRLDVGQHDPGVIELQYLEANRP
jgi:hypothetical protein